MEKLLLALSTEPWRSRLMALMKLVGYQDRQWIRVVMTEKTQALIAEIDFEEAQVLEISGLSWAAYFPQRRYHRLSYPAFDICQESTFESYDLIVIEQVLEHVLKPADALKNIELSLRPGAYALVTTPFLVRYHGYPNDYSRWTEIGLRQMLVDAGFEEAEIQTGSWGNKACLLANLGVWQRYNPYIHSLKNDARYPLMVWALAKKSLAGQGEQESLPQRHSPADSDYSHWREAG